MKIFKKINNSDISKEFKDDVSDNFFSSKDRIIKTVGVILLPMIYAFTCIFAFWNPVGAVGKTPTAIVNQDQRQIVWGKIDTSSTSIDQVKVPLYYSTDASGSDIASIPTQDDGVNFTVDGKTLDKWLTDNVGHYLWSQVDVDAKGKSIPVTPKKIDQLEIDAGKYSYGSVMDLFMQQNWSKNLIPGFGYDSVKNKFHAQISPKVTMTNISYISRDPRLDCVVDRNPDKYATYEPDTKQWNVKNSDYFLQLDIPLNFSQMLSNVEDCLAHYPLTMASQLPVYIAALKQTVNSYTTYSKSFFIGEIIDQMAPMVMGSIIFSIISNSSTAYNINPNDFIATDVPNGQFNNYGIGIGEMFLCVGLWVGAFGMTTIMKRNKKHAKMSPTKWYISKGLTMSALSVVQAVLLTFSVGCIGWFHLGPTFLLIALFMIFCGLIFTQIIQSLWFMFRDHSKGSILMIAYLVLNIASGGGTFPVFSQNLFFRMITYLMPFRYAIQAEGAMIYGLGAGVNIESNAWYIISRCLILLIFLVVFMSMGMLFARRRNKELLYGTYKTTKLSYVLSELKEFKYLNEHGQVVWSKLPNDEQVRWKEMCTELFPNDDKFLWFKNRKVKYTDDFDEE